jgi:STE24 endopeptidase
MGSRWWLYVWLVWLGFNLLVLFLYPTVIAPLFNKFTPLEDAALKQRIEAPARPLRLPRRACS